MNKPVIEITPPEVIIKDTSNGRYDTLGTTVYDYGNSHLIYKGKDLGSMESLKNASILAKRVNKTIWLVKDSYLSGLIPENIKDNIISTLMGLED